MIIEKQIKGHTIFFDNEKHKFWRMEGEKKVPIPSVTTYTGLIDKSGALMGWQEKITRNDLLECLERGETIDVDQIHKACALHRVKKQEAADIGTQIHDLAEKWIKNEPYEVPDDERIKNGFEAFLDFNRKYNVEWLESERIIYYRDGEVEYAGIMDGLAKIDGQELPFVVEHKSSNYIYPEHAFQIAAYQNAYEWETGVETGGKLVIRYGKEDGQFEAVFFKEDKLMDIDTFINLIFLKGRLKELKKIIENKYVENTKGQD